MLEKINKRLDIAIANLDNENFVVIFPQILDDLIYILVDLEIEKDKLSLGEQFENGFDLRRKETTYMGKLAKVYFKLIYGLDITIVNTTDYSMSVVGGGYNRNDGNIYYSDFGALLSSQSKLSFLHTCLHEGRHKMQHDSYKNTNLLLVEPYMLRLLKETLLEDSLLDNNRKFYKDNYSILFAENDAEIFAKAEIYDFIKNLTNAYMSICKKTEIEESLWIKVNEVNNLFNITLKKEEFNIDKAVVSQIYDSSLISDFYDKDGQSIDRMIAIDKYIKSNPELQEQYPILKLLFNGSVPKTYDEIITNEETAKQNKSEEDQRQIEKIYEEIVVLDPILLLNRLLQYGDFESVKAFIEEHPTIIGEYPEAIQNLSEKYGRFGTILHDINIRKTI